MQTITTSLYEVACNFMGLKEIPGKMCDPLILAMLQLDDDWPQDDSVPWCSAFTNYVAFIVGVERSKSLLARSWISAGEQLKHIETAEIGMDIVVLKRGMQNQPGKENLTAPGHSGFFGGWDFTNWPGILIIGGNQSDKVSIKKFPIGRILTINRLRKIL